MKQILLLLTIGAFITFQSCKKEEANELPSLYGTWQETETVPQFAGMTYRITFKEDGRFELIRTIFTDALDPRTICKPDGIRYIRGRFVVADRELRLSGNYCDNTFSTDTTDCYYGKVFSAYHIMAADGNALVLDSHREAYYRITLHRD